MPFHYKKPSKLKIIPLDLRFVLSVVSIIRTNTDHLLTVKINQTFPNQPTLTVTEHNQQMETSSMNYDYEQDCKSSMASVSIIASTNQVDQEHHVRSEEVNSQSESPNSVMEQQEQPVPYMDDLNALAKASYRLSPANSGKWWKGWLLNRFQTISLLKSVK